MFKRLLAIAVLGVTVSGCFMAPLAFVGPAASGFSTASLIQSGVTTGANYVVQKSTGKTISEHVFQSLGKDALKQSYAPVNEPDEILKQSNQPKLYKDWFLLQKNGKKKWLQSIDQNKSLLDSS